MQSNKQQLDVQQLPNTFYWKGMPATAHCVQLHVVQSEDTSVAKVGVCLHALLRLQACPACLVLAKQAPPLELAARGT